MSAINESDRLLRRGIILEYITLGWNVVGVAVVIYAALQAHSVALAGFGLDSESHPKFFRNSEQSSIEPTFRDHFWHISVFFEEETGQSLVSSKEPGAY